MANGYNGNGRPVVAVYGNGDLFTLHPPTGQPRRNLTRGDVVGMITSYPLKPVLEFGDGVPAGAKVLFRNKIAGMPIAKD